MVDFKVLGSDLMFNPLLIKKKINIQHLILSKEHISKEDMKETKEL